MEILQIVPGLPPAIDGVGDYAFLLARQLRKAHGINTRFVVCDPWWQSEGGGQRTEVTNQGSVVGSQWSVVSGQFSVYQLRERSAEELLRVLNQPGISHTVLLQYVGYGYEKRGCRGNYSAEPTCYSH